MQTFLFNWLSVYCIELSAKYILEISPWARRTAHLVNFSFDFLGHFMKRYLSQFPTGF